MRGTNVLVAVGPKITTSICVDVSANPVFAKAGGCIDLVDILFWTCVGMTMSFLNAAKMVVCLLTRHVLTK
jgi:hypothetical protein